MRITLRAFSSASISAGSFGFETLDGNRVVFESWTDGGAVTLTRASPPVVSFVVEAIDRAMKI
jgi:hypothetical protein